MEYYNHHHLCRASEITIQCYFIQLNVRFLSFSLSYPSCFVFKSHAANFNLATMRSIIIFDCDFTVVWGTRVCGSLIWCGIKRKTQSLLDWFVFYCSLLIGCNELHCCFPKVATQCHIHSHYISDQSVPRQDILQHQQQQQKMNFISALIFHIFYYFTRSLPSGWWIVLSDSIYLTYRTLTLHTKGGCYLKLITYYFVGYVT